MTKESRALVMAAAVIVVATGILLLVYRRVQEPPSAPSADLGLGQAIYQQNCAVCHGPSGEGRPPAPPMNRLGHAHHHPDWELQMVIEQGRTGLGEMPAWKGKLSDREIEAVIAYIKTLWDEDQRAFQQRINELRPTPP